MGTFSINNGQITEAISYPLHIQSNFDDILLTLKDNVDKLIDPKDIRNALLSLWSSVPFKQTSTASITSTTDRYIGLDATDPSDRDIKKKIFIGKRSYSGTQSYNGSHDIMTNTQLLDSDIDIFFYNTKPDTVSNTITRMSILSGKNTGLYSVAPFIQSEYISGATESLSIDFVAKVGNVNFNISDFIQGTFSLNNIQMPTRVESATSSGLESKTFVWRGSTSSGRVFWEELTLPVLSTIGTSSEVLTIYGDPTNVNGYSLELNTTDYTPRPFGGIPMGTTFNSVAISEVLRRILYPNLGPLCTITTINNYFELGSSPDVILNYTITKRTNPTQPASLINMTPAIVASITNDDHITISGTAIGQITNNILGEDPVEFSISVTDGVKTATASTFIQGIVPYFYGSSSLNLGNVPDLPQLTLGLLSLTKLVEPQGDKELYISAPSGQYLYFIYDANYPDLTEIIDGNNNNVISFFTQILCENLNSPQNFWSTRSFKVYKRELILPIGPPNVKYQFRY
jgi:hypothetical protein